MRRDPLRRGPGNSSGCPAPAGCPVNVPLGRPSQRKEREEREGCASSEVSRGNLHSRPSSSLSPLPPAPFRSLTCPQEERAQRTFLLPVLNGWRDLRMPGHSGFHCLESRKGGRGSCPSDCPQDLDLDWLPQRPFGEGKGHLKTKVWVEDRNTGP